MSRSMRTLSTILDYLLWPLLVIAALIPTSIGINAGQGKLAFNLTYFSFAAVLFILERVRPHEREWLKNDGQMVPDLAHTVFTKSFVQLVIMMLAYYGLVSTVGGDQGKGFWPNHWPMWGQVVLALVIAEFGLYWAHRVAHTWMPLWHFHAVHHSVKKLWFFNTGRFHIIDTLKSMIFSGPLLWLAGTPNDVVQYFGAITAYIGFLTHCNIQMKFGWLNYVFNTPELHRWHHSTDLREGDKNYGENLMLWDLIFRSFYNDPTRHRPDIIGIKSAMPKTFLSQLAMPFRWHKYQDRYKAGEVDKGTLM